MLLLNSHTSHFTATLSRSARLVGFTLLGHPFSRSYGVILPSSLTRVNSSALAYSAYPPVSVYGTIAYLTHFKSFSRQCSINQFARSVDWAPHNLSPRLLGATGLDAHIQPRAGLACCVILKLITRNRRCGNIKPAIHHLRLSASA